MDTRAYLSPFSAAALFVFARKFTLRPSGSFCECRQTEARQRLQLGCRFTGNGSTFLGPTEVRTVPVLDCIDETIEKLPLISL